MQTAYKRNVRIYFFCMTLSYSRMKFDRAIRCGDGTGESVYNSRDLIFI